MALINTIFSSPPISLTNKKYVPPVEKLVIPKEPTELRTIFVGNVPLNTKAKELKGLFKKYGKVETVRFRSVPTNITTEKPKKAAVILKDFSYTKDTMNAYVVFEKSEYANKSLEANSILFKENHLRVDFADKEGKDEEQSNKSTIFVGNLPFFIKEEELWDFFKECGKIEYVRIIRDKVTQEGKGIAYVKFQTKEDANKARKLNGKQIYGREVRIKKSTSSSKLEKKETKRENALVERIKDRKIKKLEKQMQKETNRYAKNTIKNKIKEIKDGNLEDIDKYKNNVQAPLFRKPIRKYRNNPY